MPAPEAPRFLSGNYAVSVTPDGGPVSWLQYSSGRASTSPFLARALLLGALRAFPPGVFVTPDGSATPPRAAFTNGYSATFTVTNGLSSTATFALTRESSANITTTSQSYTSVTLAPYEWVDVNVSYNVGAPGSGYVRLWAEGSGAFDSGTWDVLVMQPGPVISLLDYNQGYRDATRCVADCFDAVASYTTPPYYSTDIPRSVQLVYRSSHAHPIAFVNIGAWDTTAASPVKMSIQLKDAQGVNVAFTNGSTEFFFTCPSTGGYYACDSTSNRLAVQFDASNKPTGAYPYTLIVRSYGQDSTFGESQTAIRVLVDNEVNSPFGAGWTIAGYQRMYFAGDSRVITEGNGSIGFFASASAPGCTTCNYTSPAGDFSTVTRQGVDSWGATYTRRYPDGTTVGFRADGLMVYLQDAHRSTALCVYNGSNQLVAFRDVAEKDDSLGYVNGKLRWIKDPGGRTDSITIDSSGNLTRIRDAVGGLPFQGTYDGLHRLTHMTDRRGGAWGIAYDFAGKVRADTAPAITTAHGSGERPVVSYASLESALLPDTALHLGTWANPASVAVSGTVRAKVTTPRGYTTAFVLDRFGQAERIEAPLGRTARFTLDTLGRHMVDSLPGGRLIRYTWSGTNLMQWKDSTTGRTINYTYDPTYNLLTLMSGDVDSLINRLTSDKASADSTRIGGAAHWTESYYNPSLFDPTRPYSAVSSGSDTANWAKFQYMQSSGFRNTDSVVIRGTLTSNPDVFNPDAWRWAVTRYQYDGHGQRIRTINPARDTTWTEYDSLGRVKRIIGPRHDTTSYTYDSLYLTQVRDARGQVYKVWPNALGWPDSTMDPAGKVTRFTYDSSGNPVTVVNRRGQTIRFTYDSLDQVRSRIVGTDTARYFVDPLGRYAAVANRESVDTVKVDAAGRPIVEVSCRVLVSGSAPQCFRDSSVYEVRNLRTKLMVTAPGLWSTHTASYHYDNHMLLDTLTNFTGEKQAFTYGGELQDSIRKFLALNNLTLTYGRPPLSPWIPHSASLSFSDATLTQRLGLAYSYDTLSQITKHYHGPVARPDTIRSFVDTVGRLVAYADTAYTWLSDACSLGQLGQRCDYGQVASRNAVGAAVAFYYDSVGNRKDSPTQGYAVDPGNRLRRLGYVRMEYDFDGNLTRKRILKASDTTIVLRTDSLFWSATGQLDSLRGRDSTGALVTRVTYGYDGLGRQVRQSVAGATTRFLWDGDHIVFKLDTLGQRLARWTFYPGTSEPQSVAFRDSERDPFRTLYYVTDALHNTVALVQSNPFGGYEVHTEFRYGPFGDSLAATGTDANVGHLRYKGAFWDAQARLYRMGVRYYDPDVGRFISEDPLGLGAGTNQYAFGGNDPVNGYDPSGTCDWCVVLVFGLFMSGLASEVSSLAFQGPCDAPPTPRPPVVVEFQQGPDPCGPRGREWPGLTVLIVTAVAQYLSLMNVKRKRLMPKGHMCWSLPESGTYRVGSVGVREVEGIGTGLHVGVIKGRGASILFLQGELLVGGDLGLSSVAGYWQGKGSSFFGLSWVGNASRPGSSVSVFGNAGGSGMTVGPAAEVGVSVGVSSTAPLVGWCQ